MHQQALQGPVGCPWCHQHRARHTWQSSGIRSQRQTAAPTQSCRQLRRTQGRQQRRLLAAAAADVQAESTAKEDDQGEEYEVYLTKPLGVKFARGNDSGVYVLASAKEYGNTDPQIEAGDKVLQVSASFGADVWDAKNYGQVMYAIKTRNGEVYMRMLRRGGDMSILEEKEMTDAERRWRDERSGGNYGQGTKEMQQRRYIDRREAERKRRELFDDALEKYQAKDIEGALVDFENVLSLEPKNFVGDDFSRVTQIYRVTQYNIACCYSAMNQVEAGLDALKGALASGFDQYGKMRTDPNLDALRKSDQFKPLVDKYDEPVFNDAAFKAIKNIFKFGKGE